MVKRFLKGTLCAALSLSMALGGMMVGASTKNSTTEKITTENGSMLYKDGVVLGLKSAEQTNNEKSTRATASPVYQNARVLWTKDSWNAFANTNETNYYSGYSTEYEDVQVGTINVSQNGIVIIRYAATNNGEETKLMLKNAAGTVVRYSSYQEGVIWSNNLSKGTYKLCASGTSSNRAIKAAFVSAVVPNTNNRWMGKRPIATAGTGANNYQYFKISKRGVANIQNYKMTSSGMSGVSYYVQKKSGRSWKTVAKNLYTYKPSYITSLGLSAGTYRVVSKTYDSNVLFLSNINRTANSSYGTKKKKAKTIKRKKYKKQTFTPTDSTKKAHWYKIKVSKKRSTYIDVTSLGNEGSIWAQVSGRTRLKSKKIKNGIRFYGKAKAGTYYIKVYKLSKSTTGSYQIKYKK